MLCDNVKRNEIEKMIADLNKLSVNDEIFTEDDIDFLEEIDLLLQNDSPLLENQYEVLKQIHSKINQDENTDVKNNLLIQNNIQTGISCMITGIRANKNEFIDFVSDKKDSKEEFLVTVMVSGKKEKAFGEIKISEKLYREIRQEIK